jgi:phenylpropionate dioxygenase-like ring-hydroxylating dioxygenase large terminal subunit
MSIRAGTPWTSKQIIAKTWQWVCHVEKVRDARESYVTIEIAGQPCCRRPRPVMASLRAFYNVCKHRAHTLLSGEGRTNKMMCPYHAWVYRLDGQLVRAPHTEPLENFNTGDICLDRVQVEEFCGFIYVNFDPAAPSLKSQTGDLETEIRHWAPDIDKLTFGHRLTYDIKSNWKNVVDNFLECYHCPLPTRTSAPWWTWTPTR